MHIHVKGSTFFFFGEDTSSTNRVSHEVSKIQIVNLATVCFLIQLLIKFHFKEGCFISIVVLSYKVFPSPGVD